MKRGNTVLATSISVLVLLSLASQVSRCAAAAASEGSAGGVSTERRRVRPYLQVQEQLDGDMKDHLETGSPSRRLGPGHEAAGTVELEHHHRRITTGHKGGSAGGVAGAAGGRNVGGGGAVTRPHGSKNGAAALPVPVASVLAALALGCGVALSALSS
ncbi:uncharacterized protein [Zea mays]|uniref:Uncharacterized protein n=1 Tax=Zea mays TaxID=4577 RepID=A0A1D6Q072_MAIZE|nr:uncharacterized protein LOC109946021 [Zea mays]AQK52050.1 hypothetical protein ZEAMMB73_Zm00001d050168 [Zea mays]|eukprot:XP_020408144.1 uncharacterized protein LOC109946021 [Zea mays]